MPVHFIDILGSCLCIFGIIHGVSSSFCSLLPHNVVPLISALIKETVQLLDRAEALNVIPLESEYKAQLDMCERSFVLLWQRCQISYNRRSLANQFARMRMESNHARGFFAQLRLVVQRGLSCRLYALHYRVKALKSKLQLQVCWTTSP
jgi:hypothetical protein